MSVHSLPMKSRKRLAPGIFDTLPRILALFMTSLMQTAGHKMAALMVMCLQLSNVDFFTDRSRNGVERICVLAQ